MGDSIFSDLNKVGLGMLSGMNLYEEEEKKEAAAKKEAEKAAVPQEKDFLFDKGYRCPVCDTEFKTKAVRTGKAKMLGADTDLRPRYQGIDSLKYDCIVCNKCGYASLSRFFNSITSAQAMFIKTNITPYFKGVDTKCETYSYDEAITRHQIALANAVIKKSKASEKAYTCLKIAWLLRGQAENLPDDTKDKEAFAKELKAKEAEYIKKAYEGFTTALAKEMPPICGMDQWTLIYLVADLARQCEDYGSAMRLLSDLIVSPSASPRIKDKARDMRKLLQDKL
ncbi:MAG: DUF2225 domain-containing protein [Lachnospiraceae bacterium]|nr:DUF2225 domain-containing protein [Lachnospiraceae bacterium]